jgi:hypothetical protein
VARRYRQYTRSVARENGEFGRQAAIGSPQRLTGNPARRYHPAAAALGNQRLVQTANLLPSANFQGSPSLLSATSVIFKQERPVGALVNLSSALRVKPSRAQAKECGGRSRGKRLTQRHRLSTSCRSATDECAATNSCSLLPEYVVAPGGLPRCRASPASEVDVIGELAKREAVY